jgi:hypothetical protein
MQILRFTLCFITLSFCLNANTATLHVSGGQLTGALGVEVNGSLYDVSFMEGSCNSLYANCTNFLFSDADSAEDAAYALQHQVVTGVYDNSPELIAGIEATTAGSIWTPYKTVGTDVYFIYTHSGATGADNLLGASTFNRATDLSTQTPYTYAVWSVASPVPVPAAAWLFGSALLGLGAIKRKRS